MLKSPCRVDGKDCEKRKPGCHGTCKEYKKFVVLKQVQRNRINRQKAIDSDYFGLKKDTYIKYTRRKYGVNK